MIEIIKTKWKPTNGYTILQWGPGNGTLQILINKHPEFKYKQFGNYFYSEIDGFVSIYRHDKNNSNGFGGAKIKLKMYDGDIKEFKGTLWDPTQEINNENIPPFCSVSVTTDPKVMEKGFTFYSGKILQPLYQKLISV